VSLAGAFSLIELKQSSVAATDQTRLYPGAISGPFGMPLDLLLNAIESHLHANMRRHLVIMAVSATASLGGCIDPCDNTLVHVVKAPDGQKSAVIFERSCGATTGFSTQISILPPDEMPSDRGNVFVANLHGGGTPAAWGGPWADVQWLSSQQLLIRYDTAAVVYRAQETIPGANIRFEAVLR
jgi:hypothetical protein